MVNLELKYWLSTNNKLLSIDNSIATIEQIFKIPNFFYSKCNLLLLNRFLKLFLKYF